MTIRLLDIVLLLETFAKGTGVWFCCCIATRPALAWAAATIALAIAAMVATDVFPLIFATLPPSAEFELPSMLLPSLPN